jgi:hypothetical protein
VSFSSIAFALRAAFSFTSTPNFNRRLSTICFGVIDHFRNLAQQPSLCILYTPSNTGGTHTGAFDVKLGDSEETFLILCTADEKRAGVLSSALHHTKLVACLSRLVENFSSIAQSSTEFLNNSQSTNPWDNRITEKDIMIATVAE